MGFNVGSISSANTHRSMIDQQALAHVKEQIFNPHKDKTVDVSKLDLSKFHRANLGTDLYAARTNGEVALQAAKAATDFGIQFSNAFNTTVQYLNSQAAQSLFTSKENTGRVVIDTNSVEPIMESEAVAASAEIVETQNLKQDKRGHNPFSFYFETDNIDEDDGNNMLLELDELSKSIFVPSVNILA